MPHEGGDPVDEDRLQGQQHEGAREGQHQIHEPAEQPVDPASGEARDDPDDRADDDREDRGQQGDRQGGRHSGDDAGEQVSTGARLNTQPVRRRDPTHEALRHRTQPLDELGVGLIWVENADLRKQRSDSGQDDEEDGRTEGDHRHPVLPKTATNDLPRASALDGDCAVDCRRVNCRVDLGDGCTDSRRARGRLDLTRRVSHRQHVLPGQP